MFVGTIPLLGQSWGERGESIGSKTKLFEKVLSQEFRNSILLKSIVPAESRLGGLLTNSSVSKLLILVCDARRIPPRRAGACNTFKEPAGGLWGILN